jgi:hypothetical protein
MQPGPLVLSWLRSQTEVDPDRIALSGVSMGSFWGTQVAGDLGGKELLVYEGAEHGLVGSFAAALGPSQTTYMADWLKDRLDGKAMPTKHMKVDANGQIHESSFEEARKALSIPLRV